jgi:hypothetical protein
MSAVSETLGAKQATASELRKSIGAVRKRAAMLKILAHF